MLTAPVLTAPLLTGDDGYLGGGRVVTRRAGDVEVTLTTGETVTARLAMAFTYVPQVGDDLLVIGRGGRHFVIGVLQGQGQTELHFPGDVRVSSGGDLHLAAGDGIAIESDEVDITATRMRVVADVVVESAREVFHRVRDLWMARAGEKIEQVTGEWTHRSEKASITTAEDVSVNGREVRLG